MCVGVSGTKESIGPRELRAVDWEEEGTVEMGERSGIIGRDTNREKQDKFSWVEGKTCQRWFGNNRIVMFLLFIKNKIKRGRNLVRECTIDTKMNLGNKDKRMRRSHGGIKGLVWSLVGFCICKEERVGKTLYASLSLSLSLSNPIQIQSLWNSSPTSLPPLSHPSGNSFFS